MELTPENLALGLVWYAVFLFSTTAHEAAHAWAALRLGDRTAYEGGQVTLSPLPHVRRAPLGMVVVPLLSYLINGWMMGWASAPYDPLWADRHPRRAAWMALAGPGSNLLLTVAAALLIRLGMAVGIFYAPDTAGMATVTAAYDPGFGAALATFLSVLFSLNLLLCIFNLLPLPPLDGSGALPLLLPDSWAAAYRGFLRQPGWGLLGILLAWRLFGSLFSPFQTLALNLLYPGMGYH